jgi:hypothetical protein
VHWNADIGLVGTLALSGSIVSTTPAGATCTLSPSKIDNGSIYVTYTKGVAALVQFATRSKVHSTGVSFNFERKELANGLFDPTAVTFGQFECKSEATGESVSFVRSPDAKWTTYRVEVFELDAVAETLGLRFRLVGTDVNNTKLDAVGELHVHKPK